MNKIDYKKTDNFLYQTKKTPTILQVPTMRYVAVEGEGDPNEVGGCYQEALSLLYGISYTIKMSPRQSISLPGYVDFVVPPLEGLWMMKGHQGIDYSHKENFHWISMIRLPEFVTEDIFDWAIQHYQEKHPEADCSKARYWVYEEGLCAQIFHAGSFDEEPASIERLHRFLEEEGYHLEFSSAFGIQKSIRAHHELYLSNPKKTAPDAYKTLIRLPIKR